MDPFQAAYFDCAGIRVPKYILKLSFGSKLIVKEPFGYSVNLYRCLVQDAFRILTLATEDASRNHRVVCQGVMNFLNG